MAWSTSDRASRLPPNWQAIRAYVRDRAEGRCEAASHARGCDGIGSDADHVRAGDDHSMGNLMWLSTECHKAKTAAESAARNRERATMRRRPPEPHPGRIT